MRSANESVYLQTTHFIYKTGQRTTGMTFNRDSFKSLWNIDVLAQSSHSNSPIRIF